MAGIPSRRVQGTGILPELPQAVQPPKPGLHPLAELIHETGHQPAGHAATQDTASTPAPGHAAPAMPFLDADSGRPEVNGPTLAEIKAGQILAPGQRSQAVLELRKLLNSAGCAVDIKGPDLERMDDKVVAALSKFQIGHHLATSQSPHKGLFGPTTLASLQKEAAAGTYDKEIGKRIATAAVKAKLNDNSSGHQCYAYVSDYIEHSLKTNFLTGMHAYMAADQLAKSHFFKETKATGAQLKDLPDGAIIVYPAQGGHSSGHIEVVASHPKTGAKVAISDFTRPLTPSPWGNVSDAKVKYRVFLPVGGH